MDDEVQKHQNWFNMSTYLGTVSSLFILVALTLHNLTSKYQEFQIVLEAILFSTGMCFLSATISNVLASRGKTRPEQLEIFSKYEWVLSALVSMFWFLSYLEFWGKQEVFWKNVLLQTVSIILLTIVILLALVQLPKPRDSKQTRKKPQDSKPSTPQKP